MASSVKSPPLWMVDVQSISTNDQGRSQSLGKTDLIEGDHTFINKRIQEFLQSTQFKKEIDELSQKNGRSDFKVELIFEQDGKVTLKHNKKTFFRQHL
jgi:hypothetical protein